MASPSPASHRPRQKKKLLSSPSGSNNDLILELGTPQAAPAFPLVSFLWAARGGTSQWIILPLILMAVGLFRWAVSLWGYSGFQTPPMHGDFEAQRHWMELTIHLSPTKWYFYDLKYWGLDYPPLTAYHSWLLGKIGTWVDPTFFALDSSRGVEDPLLKLYMRATVIVSEFLIYVPAVVLFVRRYARLNGLPTWSTSISLVAILMQPSTILIDHGHFQYNTVMLGLMAASIESILIGRWSLSCVFFVASIGFKQMALYYAPIMFSFLLGSCIFPRIRIPRFFTIALTTLLAFAILLTPFILVSLHDQSNGVPLPGSLPDFIDYLPAQITENGWFHGPILQVSQIIHRIFPFARGLFEDKVANAWCAIHTFYKLNNFPTDLLQRISLGATLASIFIPCLVIFLYPRPQLILLALSSCAWGFFLFSFQVHEKSILLPLLPMTLLLSGDGGLKKSSRAWIGWANILGSWTLFPLLKREGLSIPYFVITLLWAYLLGLPPTSIETYRSRSSKESTVHILTGLIHWGFYIGMVAWHVLEAFVPPPETKPELWVVLNALIGAGGFGLAYLWSIGNLVMQAYKISGKESTEGSKKKTQ
ncbi:ALG6, ALG8 glycosyltransferase family-domain-containing protein [Talaromyces proteolyticus]|uniref:Alpha-1,3-glucosyltransferase n=1 Tax=Talaromyces proteolyticus TaxID=1131652 RepID=A0AAD4KZP7_9EURO|nr:ALG6, ALG8 glycosyltransferase family-domain-containing protein [Talaromyces proteolyticus]KAH8703583.1 ALG6, ALG8 glycosyltransferase family-domain-containing protein [Talaromyces proteolyticus]